MSGAGPASIWVPSEHSAAMGQAAHRGSGTDARDALRPSGMGGNAMTTPWIRDPRSPEQIKAEFWAEQRALRERREEIAAMPRGLQRMEAVLRDTYKLPVFENLGPLLRLQPPADALDRWLAEDGTRGQVEEALGL